MGLRFELNDYDFTAKIIGCDITNQKIIIIPKSIINLSQEYIVTNISKRSFCGNECIDTIEFPEDSKLLSISQEAFSCSNIKKLSIPPSLENLERGWCKCTSQLNTISISPDNPNFLQYDQKLILGKSDQKSEIFDLLLFSCRDIVTAIIPSNIKYISSFCFSECKKLNSIEFLPNSELVSIGHCAFSDTRMKAITIPSSCKIIGNFVFSGSKLETVNFSQNSKLSKIGKGAFHRSNLKRISIPPNVTKINDGTFSFCRSLESIDIPENSKIQYIGKNAFCVSKIKSLFIPEKLNELHDIWCNELRFLTRISVSPKNQYLMMLNEKILLKKSDINRGQYDEIVFAVSNIQKVSIPSFIRRIGPIAFSNCQMLESIEFTDDSQIESIGEYAFDSTSLTEILLPSKIERIERGAFSKCSKLRAIRLSEDSELRSIGNDAFEESSLESIEITSKLENLPEQWCSMTSKLVNFSISPLNEHFLNYKNDFILRKSNENNFNVITFVRRNIERPFIPSNIERIGPFSFCQCSEIQTIEFEENSKLLKIDEYAFNSSSIQKLIVPSSVHEISEHAFQLCKNITILEFQKNSELELIGNMAFCEISIKRVTIPEKVKKIGLHCFSECTFIQNVEILSDEIILDTRCFFNCDGIRVISLPNANKITIGNQFVSSQQEEFSLFVKDGGQLKFDQFY